MTMTMIVLMVIAVGLKITMASTTHIMIGTIMDDLHAYYKTTKRFIVLTIQR